MGPATENEKTGVDSLAMAAEQGGAWSTTGARCGFCNIKGHKESECRNKEFAKQKYQQRNQLPPKKQPPPTSQSNARQYECRE
mmetsp:Transcript_4129/g.6397  ORF Transcript_4129/g.6397 Transcript_4129/m.6397 type:complete len:83 (+) Transcript_4129:466-714(+)